MSETDFDRDTEFQRMIGAFLNKMITVHGFRFEEAYAVVHGEIQREYDQRVGARRASFTLIENGQACEIERKAKK